MGFRSTMISDGSDIQLSKEFIDKYIFFNYCNDNQFPISTKFEIKFYKDELFKDLQKEIDWKNRDYRPVDLIILHECGGITKVALTQGPILYYEPSNWKRVEFIEHSYCYGCSPPQIDIGIINKDLYNK